MPRRQPHQEVLSTKTRPDIAFAVHEVAKKMSDPTCRWTRKTPGIRRRKLRATSLRSKEHRRLHVQPQRRSHHLEIQETGHHGPVIMRSRVDSSHRRCERRNLAHWLEDNQSAIKIAKNSVYSDRSKHLPTSEMTADILTKSLGRGLHERHAIGLGLVRTTTNNTNSSK